MSEFEIIIPARMESNRLPGKPLLMAGGKALLHWTYEQALEMTRLSKLSSDVRILTSDDIIYTYCKKNSIKCTLKKSDAKNGTRRISEYYKDKENIPLRIINWQVDEPLIKPESVYKLVHPLSCTWISTLVAPLQTHQFNDSNVTKVVKTRTKCHWFSRTPMAGAFAHCGIYSISQKAMRWLRGLTNNDEPFYTKKESLEQLTWIECSPFSIHAFEIPELPLSINIQEDWDKFKIMVEQ